MSYTRQALDTLPETCRKHVEALKIRYNNPTFKHLMNETRQISGSYVLALRDAGIISEGQRRVIFCYITL